MLYRAFYSGKSPQPPHPATNPALFDLGRSGSATSQAPLLASPEILARSRRRTGNRTISEGPDGDDSELGSPPYTRHGYGDRSPHQVRLSCFHILLDKLDNPQYKLEFALVTIIGNGCMIISIADRTGHTTG